MSKVDRQFQRLVESIERLAAAPDEQRDYLSRLGVEGLTDELALEFDDALQPLGYRLDELSVSAPVVSKIDDLENALREMSGADQENLWRPDALDGPEWFAVRRLATGILEILGIASRGTPRS